MTKKLNRAELIALGIPESIADGVIAMQSVKQTNVFWYIVKLTPEQAKEVEEMYPDSEIERRYKTKGK